MVVQYWKLHIATGASVLRAFTMGVDMPWHNLQCLPIIVEIMNMGDAEHHYMLAD